MASQYYKAWNTCVKLTWQIPRASHTYFLDQLLSCGHTSTRTDILSRYSRYVASLKSSPSMEVAVMFGVCRGDLRTVTGRNISLIRQETGLDPVTSSPWSIKSVFMENLQTVPDIYQWRVG